MRTVSLLSKCARPVSEKIAGTVGAWGFFFRSSTGIERVRLADSGARICGTIRRETVQCKHHHALLGYRFATTPCPVAEHGCCGGNCNPCSIIYIYSNSTDRFIVRRRLGDHAHDERCVSLRVTWCDG